MKYIGLSDDSDYTSDIGSNNNARSFNATNHVPDSIPEQNKRQRKLPPAPGAASAPVTIPKQQLRQSQLNLHTYPSDDDEYESQLKSSSYNPDESSIYKSTHASANFIRRRTFRKF